MNASELFELLAAKTWRSLERFSRNRIHLGEDAITSNNLDTLAAAAPGCVFLEDTRATESTKGCDFELWIGSDALGWTRYAVQAKKINFASGHYRSLGHLVAKVPQIDILERYAAAYRALPIYCFYNNSAAHYSWNCLLQNRPEQLGCSVAPSSVVREALSIRGARNFAHIHGNVATLPWRCLVRCPNLFGSTAHGHPGWPPLNRFWYERLPPSVQMMRGGSAIADIGEDDDALASRQLELRPGWIGIVDVALRDDA